MRATWLTIWVLLAALPATGARAGTDWQAGAAIRQSTAVLHWQDNGALLPDGWQGISDTRARPNVAVKFDRGRADLELEINGTFSSDAGGMLAGSPGASFLGTAVPLRFHSLRWRPVADNDVLVQGWIDRADVAFRAGPLDLQLGRQPIGLGTSHFVSVLDILAPFAPGDLDSTFRPGVDALRIRTGVGDTGEAELILVGSDPIGDFAAVARSRLQWGLFDIEALAGRFRQRGFGGLGLEGEVGRAAVWAEAALVQRRGEFAPGGGPRAAASVVAGADGFVKGEVLLSSGILYQDSGARDSADLILVQSAGPVAEGWQFLSAAAYWFVSASYEAHPLVRLDGSGLVNVIDGSTFWQPRLTWSVSDEADLSLFGWLTGGRRADLSGAIPEPRSEFGIAPRGAGLYARWFL